MYSCVILVLTTLCTTSALYNAALYKPALQSSVFVELSAYIAVDGSRAADGTLKQCQHTYAEYIPWWMVDLRGQFVVENIALTNRADNGVSPRLHNFTIDIFSTDPRKLDTFPNVNGDICFYQSGSLGPGTFTYICPAPIVGRFIRIIMRSSYAENLHICEMEVMVNEAKVQESLFSSQVDTRLTGVPLDIVHVRDGTSCTMECLRRRLTDICTAFNWVTAIRTCELFSVNPFLNLTTNLTSGVTGTTFYIQNNII